MNFFSLCEKVGGGSSAVQIIPSEVDLSMGTDDEETEKNDSLNSSGERMEETVDASDIGTDVKTAGFS